MDFSLVLFDLDGTLVDCAGAGRRAIETAFREVLDLPDIEVPSRRVRFEGKTDPVIVEEIARAAGVPDARLAAAESNFYILTLQFVQFEDSLFIYSRLRLYMHIQCGFVQHPQQML